MTYKDNQPTFNVGNRKVVNFKDYLQNKDVEKAKLTKANLQSKPNSEDQQNIGNKRTEYNSVTHKLTDYSVDEIEDTLDAMGEETNEGIDNNSTNLREELNLLLKDFNLEKDLESKWKKAGVVRTFLKNNDGIEGVNDKFLWEVFDTYCEHLGSFATAMVYTGNDINDGIEMVDNGYLFDIDGFNPFEG